MANGRWPIADGEKIKAIIYLPQWPVWRISKAMADEIDVTKRGREWEDATCDTMAAFDASRDPKEFLSEIYKEATNGNQHPANQIGKTLAKCSALFVRLSADQERIAKQLVSLTWALVGFTVALLVFTLYLYKDTHTLIKREQQTSRAQASHP
jgi:hypothetical protein